jgi:acyl-coenzyme A thioesterase PaaI-like protein
LHAEIAALYNAGEHDVELCDLHDEGGAVFVHTVLRHTPRTSNAAGTIFGGSLFALADITASIAALGCLLNLMRADQPPVVCTTHGGTIAYLRCTTDAVTCTLTLPAAVAQGLRNDVQCRRKVLRTLSLDMHDPSGILVAQATLTLSARRLRERTAQRCPAVARAAKRLNALLALEQACAVGS